MAKTQSVATDAAHELKFDESTENSQRASGTACMACYVINDHCEFEIGLKRTIEPGRKSFASKGHTTMHHTPLLHANRAQIACQLQCNFCNFELRS
jgi:hypothetical protein